jgi:hypothetical protein
MPISPETIDELRHILSEDYGRDVSQADASEIAHTLVGYYDLLAKIYHREKTENNNNNYDNQRISDKE